MKTDTVIIGNSSSGLLLQRDNIVVVAIKQIYSVSGVVFALVNVIGALISD